MRGSLAAAAAVVSIALCAPASAHVDTRFVGVEMTFTDREPMIPMVQPDEPDTFSGQLISSSARCESRRAVRVFRRLPGGGKQLVGQTTSAANGSWSLNAEDPPDGTYVATVGWLTITTERPHCH